MNLPVLLEKYPAVRSWIYGLLTPLGLLLGYYGKVSNTEWVLWVGLISASLPGTVAFTNRPTAPRVQAGLTEIHDAALAQAISMLLVPENHPEGLPQPGDDAPTIEAPPGEQPYEGD